ncbi:hypothetical protein [Pseudomonas sp. PLB05]|nr:hypothetical protein [Pseudomonas sp. PLB05]
MAAIKVQRENLIRQKRSDPRARRLVETTNTPPFRQIKHNDSTL